MKIEVLQPMKYKNEANTTMNIEDFILIMILIVKLLIQLYIISYVLIELIKTKNQKKENQSYYTLINQGVMFTLVMDLSLLCKIALHQFIRLIKVCVLQWHFLFS